MDEPLRDDELEPETLADDDAVVPAVPLDPEDDHESLEALAEEEDEDEMDLDEEEEDAL